MTNEELENKFREITLLNTNIFDRYCALTTIEEDYNSTKFAALGYTIQQAYEIYLKGQGLLDTLISMFTNPDLNLDALQKNFMEVSKIIENAKLEIPENFKDILEQLITDADK